MVHVREHVLQTRVGSEKYLKLNIASLKPSRITLGAPAGGESCTPDRISFFRSAHGFCRTRLFPDCHNSDKSP
jgi:hypothetical protein